MRRDAPLIFVVVAASSVCWWPVIIEPTLDLAWWVPLIVVALCSGLATILSGGRWLLFAVVSAAATLVGLLAGFTIWPLEDGIAQSYSGIAAVAATLAVFFISLVTGLLCTRVPISNEQLRRVIWLAFLCVAAFGPAALAVRPSIVGHRLARNEYLAFARVSSLHDAVERTRTEPGNPDRVCEGGVLQKNYFGPPFTERDWHYIAGNFVTEDGYAIGITIDCSQSRHYLISAIPKRGKSDGTRRFCVDESGQVGCGPEWDLAGKRNVCALCPR
jgi:hypothetical protein